MSDELRAAVGRLRRLRTEKLADVYPETPDGPSDHLQEMRDRELLSEHYLDILAAPGFEDKQ